MTTLTALCTLLAVGILLLFLSYIALQGIGSLSFQFLIDSPRPVGEGGGIGNAILGSLVLLRIIFRLWPSARNCRRNLFV